MSGADPAWTARRTHTPRQRPGFRSEKDDSTLKALSSFFYRIFALTGKEAEGRPLVQRLAPPQNGGGEGGAVHRVGEMLGLQTDGVGLTVDRPIFSLALRQPARGIQLHPLH